MSDVDVLVLLGSLRAASVNRQIAELAAETAPYDVSVTVYRGLGDVPLYNEDIDTEDAPAGVAGLRAAAAEVDAVLVVTPANNGTIPAVLKNAIDWLSRPFGQSVLAGKPVAVIGAAEGHSGGTRAQDDTRRSFNSFGAGEPRVLDTLKLSVPIGSLDGKHPREHDELVADVRAVVTKLVAEVG